MLKVNLVEFHCLIIYRDMLKNEYIINSSLHWINNSLNDGVYLASWKSGIRNL
jgi:hypothetical protein